VIINLNDCEMLDADEAGMYEDNEEGEESAEPRPVFAVEVTNKKGKTASFLCIVTPEAALQIVKVRQLHQALQVSFNAARTVHASGFYAARSRSGSQLCSRSLMHSCV